MDKSKVNIDSWIDPKQKKLILCFSDKRKPVEFISAYLSFNSVKKKNQWSH